MATKAQQTPMTKRTTFQVACIGAGYFSQFHYDSWTRMDRVELVGACDHDPKKAAATGVPAFTALDTMLSETRPDLLDIILPPHAQAQAIRTALVAGLKWIICQKPFCEDLAQAKAIVNEAKAVGATLIVHENFRFQPWYRAIKRHLDAGDIGDIHQATFRLRPGDGQGPRAYLDRQPYFQTMPRFLVHETGVHWIDTFRYLLGNPVSVYADLRKLNPVIAGEDAGYVLFDHASGVRALFDANRHLDHAADNYRRTMGEALIEGTKGSLSLCGDGSVRLRRFGHQNDIITLVADNSPNFGGDCVHALQTHVVNAALDGAALENQASSYLDVLRIEAAIYISAQKGRKLRLELHD